MVLEDIGQILVRGIFFLSLFLLNPSTIGKMQHKVNFSGEYSWVFFPSLVATPRLKNPVCPSGMKMSRLLTFPKGSSTKRNPNSFIQHLNLACCINFLQHASAMCLQNQKRRLKYEKFVEKKMAEINYFYITD